MSETAPEQCASGIKYGQEPGNYDEGCLSGHSRPQSGFASQIRHGNVDEGWVAQVLDEDFWPKEG